VKTLECRYPVESLYGVWSVGNLIAFVHLRAATDLPGLMKRQILFSCCCLVLVATSSAQNSWREDPLEYRFTGRYGQVEVGGPYAGAEFHNSLPLPSRISFYYPVANSIDLSTDYWKRGDSHPMQVGLRIDKQPVRWIGTEPWEYALSPHKVAFRREDAGLTCAMRYEFGMKEPVMVIRFTVVNATSDRKLIETTFRIAVSLRTCQTYARFDSAMVTYDSVASAFIAGFNEPQTAGTSVFVQNVGEKPSGRECGDENRRTTASCGFLYERVLDGQDSMSIVLVIGSCKNNEAAATVRGLQGRWAGDVAAYDRFIRNQADRGAVLKTGDSWVDRTIPWANAILAANAHYLDGAIVPMPCPAEYNFFFTHDMLLTDLAANAFDTERVKRDLSYIAALAKDSIIPHARYWKDDGFKTEYCTPDNWNHLWFVLVAGSYLRHTGDNALGERIYPLLSKSIAEALRRLNADHVMYALAPDWWDIGKHEGPRAYMTALVIRALREFAFIGAVLKKSPSRLGRLEVIASEMEWSLCDRLWDEQSQYLTNFNGSVRDPHIYMGSLLAPVFGLLDSVRARQLVRTAGQHLLAEGIGIRTVMPPDFHTDSMKSFFRFAGNEAGDPYLYANGGVWPHNNAWYALALRATGRLDDAFRFYRSAMTVDGIAQSPMGQPAFYEYRYSDPASPKYGEIDKPSFLWAAGFTLLTGYRLLGINDNEWNLSFSPVLPVDVDTGSCTLEFSGKKLVTISGKGDGLCSFTVDGREVPSLVVPLDIRNAGNWALRWGPPQNPYLAQVNAQLLTAGYDRENRKLHLIVSSFRGHNVMATVRTADPVRRASVDGHLPKHFTIEEGPEGLRSVQLKFSGTDVPQDITLEF
jgi:hypothetical protein